MILATDLLNRDVRLESVAQLLGASSQTTQRYYVGLLPGVVRSEIYEAFKTPPRRPEALLPPETSSASPSGRHLRLIFGGRLR